MSNLGFKYLPVDTDERLSFLEQLLVEGQIFFPSARILNDPSEFRFHLRPPKKKATIRRQYIVDNPQATAQDFETWYRTTSWSSFHVYAEPVIRQDFMSQFGVFCLTQTCKDPIMWAHYAANHTGICVAFNIEKLLSQVANPIFGPVSYKAKLPVVRYFGEDRTKVIVKLLLTKYKGWAYEKEVRIISPQSNVTKKVSPDVIDGIIYGKEIPGDKKGKIVNILKRRQEPINTFEVQLSYTTYEMEIRGPGIDGYV